MTNLEVLECYEGYFVTEAMKSAYKYLPDKVNDDQDALMYGWEYFVWNAVERFKETLAQPNTTELDAFSEAHKVLTSKPILDK